MVKQCKDHVGRRHGLKHSPQIAHEIAKDTILCLLLFCGTIALINEYLARDKVEWLEWRNYYYSELKTKRDNIPE
jgi:hypothetical protein